MNNYEWALEGDWILHEDHAESVSPNAKIRFLLDKSDIKLAFDQIQRKQSKAFLYLDGHPVDIAHAGPDVMFDPETGLPYVYVETVQHFDVLTKLTGEHEIEIVFPVPG